MIDPFNVIMPQPLLDRLRVWSKQATAAGKRAEFLNAMKLMNLRLEFDADSWGDPLFNYPVIHGIQRRGMIANWFLVWYGLHEASRTVLVREIMLAPGCSLE